jgi:hypothetical protein
VGGFLPGQTDYRLFPEREVFGTALWVKAVNAVSEQEDYVKSLERQIAHRIEAGRDTHVVQNFLDSATLTLVVLRNQLKKIDESDGNG